MNRVTIFSTAHVNNVFWAEVGCTGCPNRLHVRYDALKEGRPDWPRCPKCIDASYQPIVFKGKVEEGEYWEGPGIGGRSLLGDLSACHYNYQPVRFTVNGTVYRGKLEARTGSEGYSTYTPGEDPTLRVGEHNIWGEVIVLWLDGAEVEIKVERG